MHCIVHQSLTDYCIKRESRTGIFRKDFRLLKIPENFRASEYGLTKSVWGNSKMNGGKNNPAKLRVDEISMIISAALLRLY